MKTDELERCELQRDVDALLSVAENGALYMHDKHMFLTGGEWVKISTDVEGVLDLVTMYYKKV